MKSISGKKLCKIVEKKGWILKKITSSHHIYEKEDEDKIGSSVFVMQWRGVIRDETFIYKDIASIFANCFQSRTS